MLQTPQAVNLYASVQEAFDALLVHYKALAKDGMTLSDAWELANDAVSSATRVIEEIQTEYGGSTKKEVVLKFASDFYDQVLAPIDLPRVPNVIETRWVDPALKEVYMLLVNGAINSIVKVSNRTGWSDVPAADAPAEPAPAQPDTPVGFIPY